MDRYKDTSIIVFIEPFLTGSAILHSPTRSNADDGNSGNELLLPTVINRVTGRGATVTFTVSYDEHKSNKFTSRVWGSKKFRRGKKGVFEKSML